MMASGMIIIAAALAAAPQPPAAVVETPAVVRPWEASAAKELETFLPQVAAGGRMTLAGEVGVRIHVGDTEFARTRGLGSDSLKDEEWVVKSFGRDVVVNGGGTRGALYAASHFLEDACGVMFLNDRETFVPPQADPLALGALDMRGRPAFRYRDIYRSTSTNATPLFAVRRRLNRNGGVKIPASLGGEFGYGPPFHCHTFDRYVPWSRYGKEHPEWFSLWKGKRIGGVTEGQLCLSQPAVRRLLLEGVLDSIRRAKAAAAKNGEPAPRLYDLSQNDGRSRYCECPECAAQAERFGHSGFYLNVVNEIADEVAKAHPDALITTLAYEFTEDLPKEGVRPRPNVVVKLCDTRSNQAASLLDESNADFRNLLAGWARIAKSLMVWDYAITYVNPANTFALPSERTIAATYRQFAASNVMGIFLEHEGQGEFDMYDLKFYLESKLMEDPGLDNDRLVAEFMKRYFDAAARPIAEARWHLDAARRRRGSHIPFFPKFADYDFATAEDLRLMASKWDAAESAVAGDPDRLRRVRKCRASQDALLRYRLSEPREAGGRYILDPVAWSCAAPVEIVADGGSQAGEAVRIPMDKFGGSPHPMGPPLEIAMYDCASRRKTFVAELAAGPGETWRWYEFKGVHVPKNPQNVFYLSRAWRPNMRIIHPGLNGRLCDMRVQAKFTGPRNVPGSTSDNCIYIGRVELVPRPATGE